MHADDGLFKSLLVFLNVILTVALVGFGLLIKEDPPSQPVSSSSSEGDPVVVEKDPPAVSEVSRTHRRAPAPRPPRRRHARPRRPRLPRRPLPRARVRKPRAITPRALPAHLVRAVSVAARNCNVSQRRRRLLVTRRTSRVLVSGASARANRCLGAHLKTPLIQLSRGTYAVRLAFQDVRS